MTGSAQQPASCASVALVAQPTAQPSHHPGLRPSPVVRQDLKDPSFPAKPLLGFWEGSEDRERKPQTPLTLIAASTFGPWPSPGDTLGRVGRGVQRTKGCGAAPATFHPETPPGGGEGVILPSDKQHRIRPARGGPGTERGWRRQDRDMTWASRLSLQRSDQRGRSAHPGCVPSAHAGSPLQDMQGPWPSQIISP